MSGAPLQALAWGALGAYDSERVRAIGSRLGAGRDPVHADRRSILFLDRPAIAWGEGRRRGLGWSERIDEVAGSSIRSWRDAAAQGASCGLVIDGRRRYLHSSISGIAPVYYLAGAGAVYFATRIDPLVATSPDPLSIDPEAWAAILSLGHPLGDRTPFAEVRRLPPYSTLRWRRGRPRVTEHRWPWAEVDARLDLEIGAGELLEALRATFARLPSGPITCPLSGGLDSRLCLGLLAERRREDIRAITADEPVGSDREHRLAAAVARTLGVPHQRVAGREADYWAELALLAERVEYQLVRSPWLVPLLEPLRRAGVPAVSGFPFDSFTGREDLFSLRAIDPRGDDAVVEEVWRFLRGKQRRLRSRTGFRPAVTERLWESAHQQWITESRRFEGHPYRSVLTAYRTRQVRGVGLAFHALLGGEARVAIPFTADEVAQANLSIPLRQKRGSQLYFTLLAAIDPRLGELPSTRHGSVPGGRRIARRSESAPAADAQRDCLERGPLRPYLDPWVMRMLTRHERGKPPRTPLGALRPSFFHLWLDRYRSYLRDEDPARSLGLEEDGG